MEPISDGAVVPGLDHEQRNEIADAHGVNRQYLYQCLGGRRQMDERDAVRLEQVTAGRIRRWQLRQADWWRVWPELVAADGAPPIPATTEETRDAA